MRKVEVNLRINTAPERIIDAFVNPDRLREWWQVERALIEPKHGGVYTLVWQVSANGFGYVSTGQIATYDLLKELRIENLVYLNPDKMPFGPISLTVRAVQVEGGSALYLCQDGYGTGDDWDWYYEAVKQAWPELLSVFKTYSEA